MKRKSQNIAPGKSGEQDGRLATIGLVAGRKSVPQNDDCLPSEEMAAIVEYPEQHQREMAHVATCETCYEEWLNLSQEYHKIGRKKSSAKIIKLFSTPRYLVATGSAMAVAASLAIFFAIPYKHVGEVASPQSSEPVLMMEKAESSVTHQEVSRMEEVPEQQAPAPSPILDPKSVEPKSVLEKEVMNKRSSTFSKRKKMEEFSAADMAGDEAELRMAVPSARNDMLESEKTIMAFSELQRELLFFCEKESFSTKNQTFFETEITRLLSAPEQLTQNEQKKLQTVLSLLTTDYQVDKKEFCRQLSEVFD